MAGLSCFEDRVCPVCDCMRVEVLGACAELTFPDCAKVGTDDEESAIPVAADDARWGAILKQSETK